MTYTMQQLNLAQAKNLNVLLISSTKSIDEKYWQYMYRYWYIILCQWCICIAKAIFKFQVPMYWYSLRQINVAMTQVEMYLVDIFCIINIVQVFLWYTYLWDFSEGMRELCSWLWLATGVGLPSSFSSSCFLHWSCSLLASRSAITCYNKLLFSIHVNEQEPIWHQN